MPGALPELPELFREDGHRMKQMGETQWMALCPWHEEKTASCSIFHKGDKWRYHCHGCGAHGDAGDYLREYRNASNREAVEAVKGNGAAGPPRPAPIQEKPPLLPELPSADVRYVYRFKNGTVAFVVLRFEATATRRKLFVPYTREGKGWRKGMHLDGPRPLYRLCEMLAGPPNRQIMVVEGEKVAKAVAKFSSKAVVVTWASGSTSWKHTDWTPLHGRSLLLVADGDKAGHDAMRALADHLAPRCPQIMLVLPPLPEEGEKALDIADIIESRPKDVAKWLREHATPYERSERPETRTPAPAPEKTPQRAAQSLPAPSTDFLERPNPHFRIVGRARDTVTVETRAGGVEHLTREAFAKRVLNLAPDWWWRQLGDYPSKRLAQLAASGIWTQPSPGE